MICREKQEELMRTVIALADEAAQKGNEPFAALLCDDDGNIIVSAANAEADEGNPIAHAETTLIRKACAQLSTRDLSDYSVFTNAECCPMCASALTLSGIRKFYYGASMEPFCNPYIRMRDVLSNTSWDYTLVENILEDECKAHIDEARRNKPAADNSLKV